MEFEEYVGLLHCYSGRLITEHLSLIWAATSHNSYCLMEYFKKGCASVRSGGILLYLLAFSGEYEKGKEHGNQDMLGCIEATTGNHSSIP